MCRLWWEKSIQLFEKCVLGYHWLFKGEEASAAETGQLTPPLGHKRRNHGPTVEGDQERGRESTEVGLWLAEKQKALQVLPGNRGTDQETWVVEGRVSRKRKAESNTPLITVPYKEQRAGKKPRSDVRLLLSLGGWTYCVLLLHLGLSTLIGDKYKSPPLYRLFVSLKHPSITEGSRARTFWVTVLNFILLCKVPTLRSVTTMWYGYYEPKSSGGVFLRSPKRGNWG